MNKKSERYRTKVEIPISVIIETIFSSGNHDVETLCRWAKHYGFVDLIKENKIPEKLEMIGCNVKLNILGKEMIVGTDTPLVTEACIVKINEIIDYLKSKGE